jgi:hypothetical protein
MSDPQPRFPVRRKRFQIGLLDLLEWMAGLGLIFALVAYLFPGLTSPRKLGRSSECRTNLLSMYLSLRNFHSVERRFPPAITSDASGLPMHSWRALMLPFTESNPPNYDFKQAWDAPANRAIARQMAVGSWGRCPSADTPPGVILPTNYFYDVGEGRANAKGEFPTIDEIAEHDGTANTILLVESHSFVADYFEPRDLTMDEVLNGINQATGAGMSSPHELPISPGRSVGGAHAVFADGSIRFLPETISRETLRAMLTYDGGETIDWSELDPPGRPTYAIYLIVGLLVMYVGWMTYRHVPRRAADKSVE